MSTANPPNCPSGGLYLILGTHDLASPKVNLLLDRITESGIVMLQLRDKQLSDNALEKVVDSLHHKLEGSGIPLILNDRIDLAKRCNVEGVHLGQDDHSPLVAREKLGDQAIIGLTINRLDQLQSANSVAGISYYGLGAMFPSPTKHDTKGYWQLSDLKEASHLSNRPIFAIGGLTLDNAHHILACGIRGLAVVSAVTQSSDPLASAQHLTRLIQHVTPEV
jgi:thiamine-phosphate pyrophosphorylase